MRKLTGNKRKYPLLEWSASIIIAVLIAAIVRSFLFTSTVETNFKQPRPDDCIEIGTPKRFDIIVFHAKENQNYIKRVIGLPGDKIEYKNDVLYIKGKAYEEKYLNKYKEKIKEQFGKDTLLTDDFTLKSLWGYERVPKDTLLIDALVKIAVILESYQ